MPSFRRPYARQTDALMRAVTGVLFRGHCIRRRFRLPIPSPLSFVITCPATLTSRLPIVIRFFLHSAAYLCSELSSVAYWMAPNMQALRPVQKNREPAVS